jgi:hypothetical protein
MKKELISDLIRKNEGDQREEIRAAVEINGKCSTKSRSGLIFRDGVPYWHGA